MSRIKHCVALLLVTCRVCLTRWRRGCTQLIMYT